MGDKTKTMYDWLRSTKLTPVQLIYVFIAIIAFIFMATDIFEALPDLLKVSFYGGTIVIGVLLGVSIVNIKKLAQDMKAIFIDNTMSPEQKVNAYGNLALQILFKFGEAFEIFQNEQFDDAKQTKIDVLQAKIDELEKQLNQ